MQPIDVLETGNADLGAGDHTYLMAFIVLVPQPLSLWMANSDRKFESTFFSHQYIYTLMLDRILKDFNSSSCAGTNQELQI